jgi:uncharacterized Zn finger protein
MRCNEHLSLAIWCPQCVHGPYGFDGHEDLLLYMLGRSSSKPGVIFRCRACGCFWRRSITWRARFEWMPVALRRPQQPDLED